MLNICGVHKECHYSSEEVRLSLHPLVTLQMNFPITSLMSHRFPERQDSLPPRQVFMVKLCVSIIVVKLIEPHWRICGYSDCRSISDTWLFTDMFPSS